MLKEYQITNFKAFAGPATIPIKPITLIFGPNSSGKSAVLQSLLMLKQTLDESISSTPTLITKGNLVDLGSHREFIHNHDTGKLFSIKAMLERPKDMGETFPIEDYIFYNRDYDPIFEELNKTGDFDRIGIKIDFSLDPNLNVNVAKIELYLGNDFDPIIVYVNEPPDENCEEEMLRFYKERPRSFLKVKNINEKHGYWSNFISYKLVNQLMDSVTGEDKKIVREIIEKIDVNFDPSKEYDGPYKSYLKEFIILKDFLPELLNGVKTQYIIHDDFNAHCSYADSISLFTISASSLLRKFLKEIIYIGPLRDYPKRDFSFSGQQTSYVGIKGEHIQDILVNNNELQGKVTEQFNRFNIDYELGIFPLSNVELNIHDLFTLRLIDKTTRINVGITDVGFGLSQVLPIIIQSLIAKEKNILIEQPELHLHPALQAELGDLFIDSALGEQKNTFIIETHSEHLILRILRRIRETSEGKLPEGFQKIIPDDIAVVYIQPTKEGSNIIHIPVTDDGDFEDRWPNGFFTDREEELF